MNRKKSVDIVAENLNSLMVKKKISARGLSAKAKTVSDHKITNLLNRSQDITLTKLDAIAHALGMETADLLDPNLLRIDDIKRDIKQLVNIYVHSDKGGREAIMVVASRIGVIGGDVNELPDYSEAPPKKLRRNN